MKRKIVAVVENHFDQIWRRCFKRDMVHKGRNFISYAQIEELYVDENLRLAQMLPDYKFQIETPCAVETYLERHPKKKAQIKALYDQGVLKTTNTGYVIADSNMVSPEAIIRNYLISDAFFAEFMGKTPSIANRSDAFGNSAQLPQILKAFGAEYVTEIYYTPFDDDVWVGLDKTALCVKKHGFLGSGGGWYKLRPCATCKGFGKIAEEICPECGGTGVDMPCGRSKWHPIHLDPTSTDSGVMRVGGEELTPAEETPAQIAALRESENIDFTLGHWDYLLERYRSEIDQVASGNFDGLKVRSSPEFNANNTGAYVTRIRIKQRLCDSENKLLAGETLEAIGSLSGSAPRSYSSAWRDFLLCAFHDSSAGTVVDQAYDEIMDLFDRIDRVAGQRYLQSDNGEQIRLFNPTSSEFNGIYRSADGRMAIIRGLKPYSTRQVTFEKPPVITEIAPKKQSVLQETVLSSKSEAVTAQGRSGVISIENDFFVIDADDNGILRITDKRCGVICDTAGDQRPCEWILQSDVGSPWATLEPPYRTIPLKDRTSFVRTEKGDSWIRICFETDVLMADSDAVGSNWIQWSVTLVSGLDRIRFEAQVQWQSFNKRLTVRFPMAVENGRDIYGIPGGWLHREPYEPWYEWNGANGDWPAFRFGGVESESKSVALLNCGTPAYRILPNERGRTLYMTVLRSPNTPVCLHEPINYSMQEYDGMRDEGIHSFTFELAAYGSTFARSRVFSDAEQFSRQPLCVREPLEAELPAILSGSAAVTHIKPAEDGNGIIVRVTEHGGENGCAVLSVPAWAKAVYLTDMPEKKAEPLACSDTLKLPLRAFEIATVRFCQ